MTRQRFIMGGMPDNDYAEAVGRKADYVRAAPNDDPSHHCHWPGCRSQTPPAMFSCRRHWFTWPKHIRDAIWAAYRPGQERTKNPSPGYLAAADEALRWAREYEAARARPNPGQGELLP